MDLNKILKKYEYTHMPYIFYQDGNPKMLFTVMQDNFWKLYYTDFQKSYKVKTPLNQILGSSRFHMCQPTCYIQNNIYKVSFCIQFRNVISLYYCQTQNLRNLKNLKLIKTPCYGGCISPSYIMINEINDVIYILKKPENLEEIQNVLGYDIIHEFEMTHPHLARTSYVYNHEDYIIISYADPKMFNNYRQFIY